MSMFEVLTIMFVTGNFVISLVKLILELIKTTKKGSIISVVGKTTVEIIELFKCTQKVP